MMIFVRFLVCLLFGVLHAFSYSFDHLPLNWNIRSTFPKINANKFIIANPDTRCILHENNSRQKIGNISLYRALIKKFSSQKIRVYTYTNTNGCIFIIGIYYESPNIAEIEYDKLKINRWLDQFYTHKLFSCDKIFASTRLIYAKNTNNLPIQLKRDIVILTIKHCTVVTTIKYKAVIKAPIYCDMQIGSIYIKSIFVNKIVVPLFANKDIAKASIANRIIESIRYLIFGENWYN